MKRVAAPMVGGMLSAAAPTLGVIPAIYLLWRKWKVKHGPDRAVRKALSDELAVAHES